MPRRGSRRRQWPASPQQWCPSIATGLRIGLCRPLRSTTTLEGSDHCILSRQQAPSPHRQRSAALVGLVRIAMQRKPLRPPRRRKTKSRRPAGLSRVPTGGSWQPSRLGPTSLQILPRVSRRWRTPQGRCQSKQAGSGESALTQHGVGEGERTASSLLQEGRNGNTLGRWPTDPLSPVDGQGEGGPKRRPSQSWEAGSGQRARRTTNFRAAPLRATIST